MDPAFAPRGNLEPDPWDGELAEVVRDGFAAGLHPGDDAFARQGKGPLREDDGHLGAPYPDGDLAVGLEGSGQEKGGAEKHH